MLALLYGKAQSATADVEIFVGDAGHGVELRIGRVGGIGHQDGLALGPILKSCSSAAKKTARQETWLPSHGRSGRTTGLCSTFSATLTTCRVLLRLSIR